MSWRAILGLVLLLAAIVSGWSAWKNRDIPSPDRVLVDRSDYVMRDFEMIALNSQGKEAVAVRAPLMERNPQDQTYTITTPLFLLPEEQGRSWELRSKTGWLSAKGEEMRLRGDVHGIPPQGGAQQIHFRTQSLNVYPDRDLATSDERVTLTQPGSRLSGIGFETNLKTKDYIFKSQVKSTYEPRTAR
ncbi:LPS export ABC transporter periplasmic protein LptC [Pseudoxanthomonas sp. F37]|uniref:LPS export ABC transporter periplasmic protein LptC n=1 Tax=Pseudoxanthomonas TaxID=83618 RepID=UPI001FD60057|nr:MULTISPECIES: LPS export ABC transporter periplasmic protein LptC [Pseudoxanthomonas]UOV04619.1 LPS export ABC transporter periplasmic protein LptC [Pseudoxanthomonas mexicana]UOV09627.1 LPS export ABC transporter periplasmic protein LptC [Pseudoxanthomonas sp. F37]